MLRALDAKNRVKLLLNMLLVASGAIPRGGTLTADPTGEGYQVTARGLNARLAPATAHLLAGTPAEPERPCHRAVLYRHIGSRLRPRNLSQA